MRNRTTEDRLNGLTVMHIYATETFEVNRVIDRFANAKKRRLLLLLSRSVHSYHKIISIQRAPPPPFESSGYVTAPKSCISCWQSETYLFLCRVTPFYDASPNTTEQKTLPLPHPLKRHQHSKKKSKSKHNTKQTNTTLTSQFSP